MTEQISSVPDQGHSSTEPRAVQQGKPSFVLLACLLVAGAAWVMSQQLISVPLPPVLGDAVAQATAPRFLWPTLLGAFLTVVASVCRAVMFVTAHDRQPRHSAEISSGAYQVMGVLGALAAHLTWGPLHQLANETYLKRAPISFAKPLVAFTFMAGLVLALFCTWQLAERLASSRFSGDGAPEGQPTQVTSPPPLQQQELWSLPEVGALRTLLTTSAKEAKEAGDPLWLFDAQQSLNDYLPQTLNLHARLGHTGVTPELAQALRDIRLIGTRRQQDAHETRWKVQQRFLKSRAGRAGPEDEDLTLP